MLDAFLSNAIKAGGSNPASQWGRIWASLELCESSMHSMGLYEISVSAGEYSSSEQGLAEQFLAVSALQTHVASTYLVPLHVPPHAP